jgi:hypothetical protein
MPGVCQGCGARFEGNAETSQGAVEALLQATSQAADIDAGALTRAFFEIDPESELARNVAIASDERQGFYNWWVFIRTDELPIGTLLRRVLASG